MSTIDAITAHADRARAGPTRGWDPFTIVGESQMWYFRETVPSKPFRA